jgi:hypothetical protein
MPPGAGLVPHQVGTKFTNTIMTDNKQKWTAHKELFAVRTDKGEFVCNCATFQLAQTVAEDHNSKAELFEALQKVKAYFDKYPPVIDLIGELEVKEAVDDALKKARPA